MFKKFEHICGGSLITRKHILSAAHCFDGTIKKKNYKVIVGSNNLQRGKVYYIKAWLTYDKWASINNNRLAYSNNDVALVEVGILKKYFHYIKNFGSKIILK